MAPRQGNAMRNPRGKRSQDEPTTPPICTHLLNMCLTFRQKTIDQLSVVFVFLEFYCPNLPPYIRYSLKILRSGHLYLEIYTGKMGVRVFLMLIFST